MKVHKKGDTVKIKNHGYYSDQSGVIIRIAINSMSPYFIELENGESNWFDGKYIYRKNENPTIVDARTLSTFTKDGMISGMIVEFRNGKLGLLVGDDFIGNGAYYSSIYEYDDDLKSNGITDYDIMKVYQPKRINMISLDLDDSTLFYSRDEVIPYSIGVMLVKITHGNIPIATKGLVVKDNGEELIIALFGKNAGKTITIRKRNEWEAV